MTITPDIARAIASLIPGANAESLTVTISELLPTGGANTWTGTVAGLASTVQNVVQAETDRANKAEAALARVRDLAADMKDITGARWSADILESALAEPTNTTSKETSVNDTAPTTGIYRDLLDPHCNALNISATDATTYYEETVPVVQLSITSDVACDEDDNIVYIRLEDVDSVIGMIRAAAKEAGK